MPAPRADRDQPGEPGPRERADQADLRHRQQRDRRAPLGLETRRAVRQPGRAGDVRQRTAPRARHGAPARELGRRPAGDRRGDRAPRRRRIPDVAFVLPLHPNPRVRSTLRPLLDALANVLLCEPVSYGEFARLLARCDLVITDSGGIQEEAPALGKPVLVTREMTERIEGVDAGTLALVGTDPDRIFAVADTPADRPHGLRGDGRGANPYGDGQRGRPDRRRARVPARRRRGSGALRLEPRPPRGARRDRHGRWRHRRACPCIPLPIGVELPVRRPRAASAARRWCSRSTGVPLAGADDPDVAFLVIVAMCGWTVALFVRGQRSIARAPEPTNGGPTASPGSFSSPR